MAVLIEESAIPIAMVGLLYALPNTQLTRRLEREGRLFVTKMKIEDGAIYGDQCTAGLNFVTKRPRRDALMDYRMVLDRIYSPAAFFDRLRRVGAALRIPRRTPIVALRQTLRESGRFLRLMFGITISKPDMRRRVWSILLYTATHNPRAISAVMRMTAAYVHLGPFSRYVIDKIDEQIRELDDNVWTMPALVAPPEDARILVH
jgi:Domain of unknown function (DUF4070)